MVTPSVSGNSNLSQDTVPQLPKIHEKLWGRHNLVGQIFHKVNLTKTNFVELQDQDQLQSINPSHSSTSYITVDVFASKSGFLRSRSFINEEAIVYFTTCDAAPDGNLVPQPIIDSLKGVMDIVYATHILLIHFITTRTFDIESLYHSTS